VRPEALRAGEVDDPDGAGPLRAVLGAIAEALEGASPLVDAERATATPATTVSGPTAALVAELGARLGAPLVLVEAGAADELARLWPARPPRLALGAAAERLPLEDRAVLVARALEDLRSGTYLVDGLEAGPVRDLLLGVARALGAGPAAGTGAPADEGPLAAAVAAALAGPGPQAVLAEEGRRDRLAQAVGEALAVPLALNVYRAGRSATADRVAALVSRSPLAALRRAAAGDSPSLVRTQPMVAVGAPGFAALVRGNDRLRRLIAFLLSGDYARGLEDG
jgi:hypothetical protein